MSLMKVKKLLWCSSFMTNCLCAISCSMEFSFLTMLTNILRRFLCNMVSMGGMPRSAKETEFEVLSGNP